MFSYSKSADELQVCLGQIHIPVQPLSPEQLIIAHAQKHKPASLVQEEQASGSRIVKGKSKAEDKVVAFSGVGRTLADTSGKAEEEKDKVIWRQYSLNHL